MAKGNKFYEINGLCKHDFSVSCNPISLPSSVFNGISVDAKTLSFYPSYHGETILPSLAKFLNLKKENLMVANGSTEIFFIIPTIFKFNHALLPSPSFWEYDFTVSLNNLKKTFFNLLPSKNFEFDVKDFSKKIKNVDCVYFCNPNNPSSSYIEKAVLISLIKKFKNKMFIVDETYLLFFKDYLNKSLIKFAPKLNNLIVVSSLSKVFGIGGLRMGFCVASKRNIDFLRKYRNPYSLNIINEKVTPNILEQTKYLQRSRAFVNLEKLRAYKKINRLGWVKAFKPEANFILIEILDKRKTLSDLEKFLVKYSIRIRRGDVFNGLSDRYFRICIRSKRENDLLISALEEFNKV